MAQHALARLGMDLDTPSEQGSGEGLDARATTVGAEVARDPAGNVVTLSFGENRLDHFVKRDGLAFAGTHLIVDLWGCRRIDDLPHVDAALREATVAAGATLLNIDLHHFSPNNGVSGVAVLAESHISIHTWPEIGYAAIDLFMCGDARPHNSIAVLKQYFTPASVHVTEHKRGLII